MGFLDTAVDPRTQSYLDARASMLAELSQLEAALEAAREGGGEKAVARHHARGKLLARERVELLVDRDSPLMELSPVAGWGTGGPVGAGVVTAIGAVEDRPCVIVASDPTVRGGAIGGGALRKICRAQEIAYQNRLPMVSFIETTGYEQTDQPAIRTLAGRAVAGYARLAAAGVPTAGVVAEPAGAEPAGGTDSAAADLAEACDYLVSVARTGSGPAGWQPAGRPVDHHAEDDRDAVRLARQCVRRFGTTGSRPTADAVPPVHDPEDLLAVPATDPREVLGRVLDGSEFDELRPAGEPGPHAGWGHLYGRRVAILAGGPAAGDADKATRLVRHAEATRTPLLLLRHGPPAPAATPAGTSVPVLVVRVGPWHGLSALDAGARFRFAWPSAHAGPAASALQLSGQLDDDGIIDPRDTRTVLGLCLSVIDGGVPVTAARRQAVGSQR